MKKTNTVHKLMLLALPMLMLAGCGSGSPPPVGATVVISPDKIAGSGAARATCAFATDNISYSQVTVTVLGSNSKPIANVDINYSLDFTLQTASGSLGEAQRIYLGPVTGTLPPPKQLLGSNIVRTDAGGKFEFVIGTDLDCTHTGDFTVHSGSASAKTTITVK